MRAHPRERRLFSIFGSSPPDRLTVPTGRNRYRTENVAIAGAHIGAITPEMQPGFALTVGLAALHRLALGYNYDIRGGDVLDAYAPTLQAASAAGVAVEQVQTQSHDLSAGTHPWSKLLETMLGRRVGHDFGSPGPIFRSGC